MTCVQALSTQTTKYCQIDFQQVVNEQLAAEIWSPAKKLHCVFPGLRPFPLSASRYCNSPGIVCNGQAYYQIMLQYSWTQLPLYKSCAEFTGVFTKQWTSFEQTLTSCLMSQRISLRANRRRFTDSGVKRYARQPLRFADSKAQT